MAGKSAGHDTHSPPSRLLRSRLYIPLPPRAVTSCGTSSVPLRLKVRLLALSSTQASRPHRRRSSPPPTPRTCRNSSTSTPPCPWQCHSLPEVVAPPQTGSPQVWRITPGTKSPRGLTRCPHSLGLTRAFGDALGSTTFARALPPEDPPHRILRTVLGGGGVTLDPPTLEML